MRGVFEVIAGFLLLLATSTSSPLNLSWWLRRSETKVYSQNGEDGLLGSLIDAIEAVAGQGSVPATFVEFGAEDGSECNTRFLKEQRGFSGVLLDGSHEDLAIGLHRAFITSENINSIFEALNVPQGPSVLGVLSCDLDMNDFHVWSAILDEDKFQPVIVIVEYNSSLGPGEAVTVPYDPMVQWDGSHWYGASLRALDRLAHAHGYALAAADSSGTNAFFIDTQWPGWKGASPSDVTEFLKLPTVDSAFVRAAYGGPVPGAQDHSVLVRLGPTDSLTLTCPGTQILSSEGGADLHLQQALLDCASAFVARHALESGMGCGTSECVAGVLVEQMARRRWVEVSLSGKMPL